MVGITVEKVLSVGVIGLGVPFALTLARGISRGFVAHGVASGLLYALAILLDDVFGDDAQSARNYAEVGGDMLLLTTLGEVAVFLRRQLPTSRYTKSMRVYDCTAMLLVSFLVIGQLVEVLDSILPFDIAESGTFLGLVLAGLAYSIRDVLVCFIAGLYETTAPVVSEGDDVRVGEYRGIVTKKNTTTVTLRGRDGETIYLPCTMLVYDAVSIAGAGDGPSGPTKPCAKPKPKRDHAAKTIMQYNSAATAMREA